MNFSMAFRFSILCAAGVFLLLEFPDYKIISGLTGVALVFLLAFFGLPVTMYKNFLLVEYHDIARIFALSAECSGVIILSIFLLSVFITPEITLKKRIVGLFFIPILFLGNVLRIVLDILIGGKFGVEFTVFFHDTIGQVLLFAWAVGAFYVWLKVTGEFPHEIEAYGKLKQFLLHDNPPEENLPARNFKKK